MAPQFGLQFGCEKSGSLHAAGKIWIARSLAEFAR
jgi:hypothetical protein